MNDAPYHTTRSKHQNLNIPFELYAECPSPSSSLPLRSLSLSFLRIWIACSLRLGNHVSVYYSQIDDDFTALSALVNEQTSSFGGKARRDAPAAAEL